MRNIILVLTIVIASVSQKELCAQQLTFNDDYKTGLRVGERVPDSFLQKELLLMENDVGEFETIRLHDFEGKLVILDFWHMWCSTCIAAFPKMEALQNEFPDKVQVLLINKNSRSDIDERFRSLRNPVHLPNLPALGPEAYSALSYLFPHNADPHHVWIDVTTGKVIAITNGYNTTTENVGKYLRGEELAGVNQKIDHHDRAILHKEPILKVFADEGKLSTAQYVSWLSPREELFGTVIGKVGYVDSIYNTFRTSYPNYSVIDLLRIAFTGDDYKWVASFINANSRISMDFSDSGRFLKPHSLTLYDEWAKDMEYTYEQIIPLSDTSRRFVYMQEDLNRYFGAMFGLNAKVEERTVLSIVAKGDDTILQKLAKEHKDKKAMEVDPTSERGSSKKSVQRMLSTLYYFFADELLKDGPFPFVYEVSLDPTLVFTLKSKYTDFEELREDLAPYGVILSKELRRVPMLVIEKAK